jgi:hypothetical protein
MEKKVLFGAWFILTLLATAIVLLIRQKRIRNWALELTDTMHIMVGGFSSLSGLFLVYKVITEFEKLEPIVGVEGMVSICLGSLATIWFGITEIATLIPPKQTPTP